LVEVEKEANIRNAETAINRAVASISPKVEMLVLPEIWNSPYATTAFPHNAEVVPNVGGTLVESLSPSTSMLCSRAKELGIWIVGGSIPEKEIDESGNAKIYNTCTIINSSGEIVGKHRKMHLFDIDIPGKMTFKESDSLTPGSQATVVNTPWGNIGVGICYDMRFAELGLLMRQRGCRLLIYPGAFNMVTGPAHWQLLQQARALDNQLFVAACSPARGTDGYIAWGHSSIVSPWGEVVASTGADPDTVVADIDFDQVDTVRQNIPISMQKRVDVYSLQDYKA
jgi:omega-amidase